MCKFNKSQRQIANRTRIRNDVAEILPCRFLMRSRLICHAKHNDRRMIFITRHQLADQLFMHCCRFRIDFIRPEIVIIPPMHTHGRDFIDNQKSVFISKIHHFFAVRIMACTERVGIHPFQQLEITNADCRIVPLTDYVKVFVHTKALKIDGFIVQIEAFFIYMDFSNTKSFFVFIALRFNYHRIQIRRFRRPRMRLAYL